MAVKSKTALGRVQFQVQVPNINTPAKVMALVVFLRTGVSSSEDKVSESIIDADYIVYKCCAATETEIDFGEDLIVVTSRFSEAYEYVERELYNIASDLGCFDDSILFFSDSVNFRKSIDPAYKGHRNRKKPCGYKRVINKLKEEYHVVVMPTLRLMMHWASTPPKNLDTSSAVLIRI
jgi:hypothetical protein